MLFGPAVLHARAPWSQAEATSPSTILTKGAGPAATRKSNLFIDVVNENLDM